MNVEVLSPIAMKFTEACTAKQYAMIREAAAKAGVNPATESHRLHGCNAVYLTRRAASEYIDRLRAKESK